jgi:hypothetical protein
MLVNTDHFSEKLTNQNRPLRSETGQHRPIHRHASSSWTDRQDWQAQVGRCAEAEVDAPPAPKETKHDRDLKNLTHAWSIPCESPRRRNLSAAPDVTHTQLIGDRAEHQEHT